MPNLEDKIVSNIAVYLDEFSQNVPTYLYAKQYDANSRYINVKLMTSTGQYFATGICQLNASKPNGERVYIGGTNNPDGTVTFEITSNILSDPGNVSCDISIFASNDQSDALLTSSVFFIAVDRSNYDADAIEGYDEWATVTQAILQMESLKDEAEDARDDAIAAAQSATSFVSFEVKPDGSLYINRSEHLGTTSFALNANGELEVTI